jgi:hypothetical protein
MRLWIDPTVDVAFAFVGIQLHVYGPDGDDLGPVERAAALRRLRDRINDELRDISSARRGRSTMSDRVDWRAVAADLYAAIGDLEDATPGGAIGWPPTVQVAINAYEYALDAEVDP